MITTAQFLEKLIAGKPLAEALKILDQVEVETHHHTDPEMRREVGAFRDRLTAGFQ